MAAVLQVFDRWKEFLNERVQQAEGMGMNKDTITKMAVHIGEFLANKVDPENKEERLLKELWDVADENEKETISRLMVKLVTPGVS
jgi:nuclear transport factor 2 (NTF2) superfamily protein